MIYYKLTGANGLTSGGTAWAEGMTHAGTGEGDLCGPGWIHVYTHPLLAVFLKPLHADFKSPLLWRGIAEGKINDSDHGLKVGVERFTVLSREPLPHVTAVQRIAFGVLCASEVSAEAGFAEWAKNYFGGKDRSQGAAARKAYAEEAEEAEAVATCAADMAWEMASEADAAGVTIYATEAWAARTARNAARAAAAAGARLPLAALAEKAITFS